MELLNEGPIKHVTISADWERTSAKPDSSTASTLKNFALKDDPQVVVQFYYDGNYSAAPDGEEFLEMLSKAPHTLTEEELPFVFVISGGAGHPDHFDTRYAGTEIIQGKTVLVINGVWKSNKMSDFAIFAPRDNAGREVQEIHFVSPADKYQHYLPAFEQLIRSIEWN